MAGTIVANGLFSRDKLIWIKQRAAQAVQFKTSDFGFEVQDSSNFKISPVWYYQPFTS
jgi:hypothetical protein